MVRNRYRMMRLATTKRRTRVDANYYLTSPQWQGDQRRSIIESSVTAFEHTIVDPPHFGRTLPAVCSSGVCAKVDARKMLEKARAAMPPVMAHASMRTIVAHLRDGLDHEDASRFTSIFEAVLLGVHRGDGTEGDVTAHELNFMRSYFGGPIAKELGM
jgi:hypothetical protein